MGECRGGEALDMMQAMNSGHAGSMTTLHAELVRSFYDDMWNRFDVSILERILHPEVDFRGSLGQSKHGHREFAEYVEYIRRFSNDFHNEVVETIGDGHRLFARLTYTGTHHGEVFGIAPTGRRFEYSGAAVFSSLPRT